MTGNSHQAEHEELIRKAQAIAKHAYAPYSKFRVGAAVAGQTGVHLGTNVENASWGLTICAERSALAAAVAAQDLPIRVVAVACIDADRNGPPGSLMPCGACRQWLTELAPHAIILVAGDDRAYHVDDLLPQAFRLP